MITTPFKVAAAFAALLSPLLAVQGAKGEKKVTGLRQAANAANAAAAANKARELVYPEGISITVLSPNDIEDRGFGESGGGGGGGGFPDLQLWSKSKGKGSKTQTYKLFIPFGGKSKFSGFSDPNNMSFENIPIMAVDGSQAVGLMSAKMIVDTPSGLDANTPACTASISVVWNTGAAHSIDDLDCSGFAGIAGAASRGEMPTSESLSSLDASAGFGLLPEFPDVTEVSEPTDGCELGIDTIGIYFDWKGTFGLTVGVYTRGDLCELIFGSSSKGSKGDRDIRRLRK